jgi:hypothetical protein
VDGVAEPTGPCLVVLDGLLRERAFPALRWRALATGLPQQIEALGELPERASPREIDRRLRAALAFLQGVDFELGRVLRPMVDRRLFAEWVGRSGALTNAARWSVGDSFTGLGAPARSSRAPRAALAPRP